MAAAGAANRGAQGSVPFPAWPLDVGASAELQTTPPVGNPCLLPTTATSAARPPPLVLGGAGAGPRAGGGGGGARRGRACVERMSENLRRGRGGAGRAGSGAGKRRGQGGVGGVYGSQKLFPGIFSATASRF
uniref:uncharacterized PE-PGRS family protein PE_PGRS10-like n=1 Tax=Callithrix jacchus TaxID=9483 RepID=UPI0023DD0DD2|nr:uncharacterized PE-PGRS family protein PE_PGRS10-like [Callithrix jacchus]